LVASLKFEKNPTDNPQFPQKTEEVPVTSLQQTVMIMNGIDSLRLQPRQLSTTTATSESTKTLALNPASKRISKAKTRSQRKNQVKQLVNKELSKEQQIQTILDECLTTFKSDNKCEILNDYNCYLKLDSRISHSLFGKAVKIYNVRALAIYLTSFFVLNDLCDGDNMVFYKRKVSKI
jgi:hypothetical protein